MQSVALQKATAAAAVQRSQERLEGEAFAARWRAENPHKAALDELYPTIQRAAVGTFPYPGHRHCGEWS